MKVTLTAHYDGHRPGDTVDVDAETLKALVRDGRATQPKPAAKAPAPPAPPAAAAESAPKQQVRKG